MSFPQTHFVYCRNLSVDGISDYVGLDIELNPTVTVSGVLQGYDINPTSDTWFLSSTVR